MHPSSLETGFQRHISAMLGQGYFLPFQGTLKTETDFTFHVRLSALFSQIPRLPGTPRLPRAVHGSCWAPGPCVGTTE